MRVVGTGEGISGMDKFSSKVNRMHIELRGNFCLLLENQDPNP